jgi:hypothetical protein
MIREIVGERTVEEQGEVCEREGRLSRLSEKCGASAYEQVRVRAGEFKNVGVRTLHEYD